MNRLIAWMAAHPVAANLLMGLIMVAGVMSALTIKQEVFPEISFDVIETRVAYAGASPDEIEESIVQRIEEQIQGIDGIERIIGIAAEGVGVVRVELARGITAKDKLDEFKSAVDRITAFPEQIERPITRELANRQRVVELAIFGDVGESVLREQAQRIKDDLSALPNVSLAEVSKVRDYELSIEVPNDVLRAYGLTLADIAAVVRRSSLDLPGGDIKTGAESILLRTKGRSYTSRDFEDIVIVSGSNGANVRLGDIATIHDGFRDEDLIMRYNGKPAAFVRAFRVGEEKVLDVVKAVEQYVDTTLRADLPTGIDVTIWRNDATEFNNRLNLLIKNGTIGIILVMLSLSLFLDLALAFWVSAGIAVAFVGAFAVMAVIGLSINMMSLFGFILAIGIVVDDAIVMGEKIYDEIQKGGDPMAAAIRGAQRVALPVTLAVATTMVAFLPLLFAPGTIGKFLFQIPAIVIIVLAISVLEALLIMPHHLSRLKLHKTNRNFVSRLFARLRAGVDRALNGFVNGPLESALRFSVAHYMVIIAGALGVFIMTIGVISAGYVKFSFFPQVEGRYVTAKLEMAEGTPAQNTLAYATELERLARLAGDELTGGQSEIVQTTLITVGTQEASGPGAGAALGLVKGNIASVIVEMIDPEERTVTGKALENRWRELAASLPPARKLSYASNVINLGSPVQVQLSARTEAGLAQAVSALRQELDRIDGVFDVRDDREPGKRELQFVLKPYARTLGLTVESLSQQVRAAFYGAEAARIQRGRDEVRVYVRLPISQRNSLGDISQYRVRTPDGGYVPIDQVAQISLGFGAPTIVREDGRRMNTVRAEIDLARITGQQVNARLINQFLPELEQQVAGLSYAMGGEQREQGQTLPALARSFLLAVFVMFALLALAFRSYAQPFIVIVSIPFGLVGATIGHMALDLSFGLTSLFGIVGLSGIIVNGALVLVDFVNEERARGLAPAEAIISAAKSRFRPVFLTAVTTFLGIFPLIIERSIQAQFLIPLAVSIAVGVLLGTVLLMLLTPAMVMLEADLRASWRRFRGHPDNVALPAEGD